MCENRGGCRPGAAGRNHDRGTAASLKLCQPCVTAAYDFIQKPIDLEHLKQSAGARHGTQSAHAREHRAERKNTRGALDFRVFVGDHPR